MVDWLHGQYLLPFDQLWVPDAPPPHGLAGELVAGFSIRQPDAYLGPISRFDAGGMYADEAGGPPLALLSGPEPQRTLLEQLLIRQAKSHHIPLKIVQGLPDRPYEEFREGPVEVHSFLTGQTLAHEIQRADTIISRAGYSSLLDFAALGTKGLLLVPTPGQTEQEYLAQRLGQLGHAHTVSQHQLDLSRDLPIAKTTSGFVGIQPDYANLTSIIQRWIAQYKE